MISVKPITMAIGAEISGVDFSSPLTETTYKEIYKALIDHCVIFFRDTAITPQAHLDFARLFGELDEPHPLYPHVDGFENIVLFDNDQNTPPDTNSWHTDLTYKQEQAFASVLVSRRVPEVGGDTMWSSNYAAYDRLSPGMKQDLASMDAVHDPGDFRNTFSQPTKDKTAIENLNQGMQNMGCTIRPLIATHPISGRRFLNFNDAFVNHILGLSTTDSNALRVFLANHMNKPEDQVRWRWQKNDLVMWDNRVTMHYAVADYLPQPRRMNRITIVRDRQEQAGEKAA